MRYRLLLPVLLVALSAALSARAAPPAADDCAPSAREFAASLTGSLQARALWPFATALRDQWSYRPGGQFRREGVRTGELPDAARARAQALLRCVLSAQGYLKTTAIMGLDDLVRERAPEIVMWDGKGPIELGQDYFWYTLFGEPGAGPWGFQLEGHHLALNFTLVDGQLAVTPAFWGAWPARIETGPRAGFAPLAAEEDRAFALLASLDDAQRQRAVVAAGKPQGIFTSPERKTRLDRFEGVPAIALGRDQRRLLDALVDEYLGNFPAAVASAWRARIAADGADTLHFSWRGPTTRGAGIYYRIHGPSLLIEFDHAPDIRSKALAPDPNHVHTIVRRPGDDLGADLLARHYAESPHHARQRTPAALARQ